jgi:hypothetical protein
VPFALPPSQASIGGATQARARPADEVPGGLGASAPRGVTFRGGIHPLAVVEEMRHRTIDFGFGYGYEQVGDGAYEAALHAPYVELDTYPLRFGTGWLTRVGARTFGEVLIEPSGPTGTTLGVGATLALAVEITDFADGAYAGASSDGGVAGFGLGEGGMGAFVGIGQRVMADESYWIASAGVSARLPATAGVFCCVMPRL